MEFSVLHYSHLGRLTDNQEKKQWISVLGFSSEERHTSPAQMHSWFSVKFVSVDISSQYPG